MQVRKDSPYYTLGQDNNVGTIKVTSDGSMYPWNKNWRKKGDDHDSKITFDPGHPEIIGDDATLPPESETPPPGWMPSDSSDSHPPNHDDHDSHGDHDSHDDLSDTGDDKPGALKLNDVHNKPVFIFDSPDHDSIPDFHHHHHEIWTTTTPPPPPPPPPKIRPGHYPIVLKLWYVNIAWGIWFIFYCMYLMLKSVGRKWTKYPNHLQQDTSSFGRELSHSYSNQVMGLGGDLLQKYVMGLIEDYAAKEQIPFQND